MEQRRGRGGEQRLRRKKVHGAPPALPRGCAAAGEVFGLLLLILLLFLGQCFVIYIHWDVAYILSFEELAWDLGVRRTDPVLKLCYQRPANIMLAPKLVCLAYNEEF